MRLKLLSERKLLSSQSTPQVTLSSTRTSLVFLFLFLFSMLQQDAGPGPHRGGMPVAGLLFGCGRRFRFSEESLASAVAVARQGVSLQGVPPRRLVRPTPVRVLRGNTFVTLL